MPTYTYLAKKNLKETVEGILVADSQEHAVDKLIEMGLSPVRVEPLVQAVQEKSVSGGSFFLQGGLTQKDLQVFTSQLKSLMKARVDLLKSLSILYGQADKPKLKNLILDLHNTIKNGASFSVALAKYPYFFSNLYVNLIKIGEASGRLDDVLTELDGFLSREQEFKMHLKTAMAYPTLMMAVGAGAIFVLFSYVIPKLSAIFSDFDYQLPLPTRVMLAVSSFFQSWWWMILLGAAAAIVLLVQVSRTEAGRSRMDWVKLHIPVWSGLILKQALARFCRTLSLLIRSGLPAFQSLQVAIPTLENAILIRELDVVKKDVLEGTSMASSMKKVSFFPSFLIQMISVGEEGGKLEGVLGEVANIYTEEIDARLKVITSLLEPVIILVLGLILGAIVMAMLLPILQINLLIK
ncbi:MAG: type II secretion system F family protein [Candidatus Babeliales bacterium]|nr:type II secretion system F family protein [Candidatus Omnitrophota bacterium]